MITEENASLPGFAVEHFSVSQVARMWGLSVDAIRRLFENEPGVLVLGTRRNSKRRHYRTMRIPASVVERVHRRLSKVQEAGHAEDFSPAQKSVPLPQTD